MSFHVPSGSAGRVTTAGVVRAGGVVLDLGFCLDGWLDRLGLGEYLVLSRHGLGFRLEIRIRDRRFFLRNGFDLDRFGSLRDSARGSQLLAQLRQLAILDSQQTITFRQFRLEPANAFFDRAAHDRLAGAC